MNNERGHKIAGTDGNPCWCMEGDMDSPIYFKSSDGGRHRFPSPSIANGRWPRCLDAGGDVFMLELDEDALGM